MPNFSGKITYGDKVEEYLLIKKINGLSNVTLTTYKWDLNSIGISKKQLFNEINWQMVVANIYAREDISPYSKTSYLKALRAFINWAEIDIHFKIPSVETVKVTYTDDELRKLLAKPKNASFGEFRTWAMISLALDTGLRSSTLRNILIKDIQGNTVVVRHSKTKKVRTIPFSDTTRAVINLYLRNREGTEDDFLFCDIYGAQLTSNALRHAVARYNHDRGVEKTGVHMFRHTFAKKYLLDCNGNPYTLQKMLMHSSMEMTKQYCNIYDADLISNYQSPVESLRRKKIRMK